MSSKFEAQVLRAVEKFSMLEKGDRVIVALSGGADSVSLLGSLLKLESFDLKIYAAHLNHNLRGEEARRDENFVRGLCAEKGVELFVRSVDVAAEAKMRNISEELCGREIRYEFFDELSKKLGAKIATAHTASDNAETVIFNLTRGSGLRGVCGIPPVRGRIIRPLIFCTRDEVETYCGLEGLNFVTDSTNLSENYTRNKIRHRVIPALKSLNPEFEKTVIGECGMFRDINSYLELNVESTLKDLERENGFDAEKLSGLPAALRSSALLKILENEGIVPERKHIRLIENILTNSGAVELHGNVRAVCKQGLLRIVRIEDEKEFSEKELKPTMVFEYKSKQYSVKELKSEFSDLVIRTRRAGDFFTLPRRRVTKTIKKLFNELKIPEEKRGEILVAARGSEVHWIEGVGASGQARDALVIEVKYLTK